MRASRPGQYETTLIRKRDELPLVPWYQAEASGLPIRLGLLDAVPGTVQEIPPDMLRAVHRLAAEQENAARTDRSRQGDPTPDRCHLARGRARCLILDPPCGVVAGAGGSRNSAVKPNLERR
jgi:hypothetical protein